MRATRGMVVLVLVLLAGCESGPAQLRPLALPLACPCDCHCEARCKMCPEAHKLEPGQD